MTAVYGGGGDGIVEMAGVCPPLPPPALLVVPLLPGRPTSVTELPKRANWGEWKLLLRIPAISSLPPAIIKKLTSTPQVQLPRQKHSVP